MLFRSTFNLYVMDGYTHKEIGEKLGTSVGTSKSNLARAKAILKEKIETDRIKIIVGFVIFSVEKGLRSMIKTNYSSRSKRIAP